MDIDYERLPNLIMPGGQKCGTSALARFLSLHPDCVLSDPKEPSFFSRESNLTNLAAYGQYFSVRSRPKVLFEASTGYLFDSSVPDRIRRVLIPVRPDLKCLIVLRRPVDRAFSAYLHLKKRFDDRRSVLEVFGGLPREASDAFRVEQSRIEHSLVQGAIDEDRYKERYDDCLWQFRYVRNSWYIDFIRAFHEAIGLERIKVVFTEELSDHPYETMIEVFDFLNLSPFRPVDFRNKVNPTVLPPGMDIFRQSRIGPFGWLLKRYSKKLLPRIGVVPKFARDDERILARLRYEIDRVLAMQYTELSALVDRDVEVIWPRFDNAHSSSELRESDCDQ